MATSLTYEQLAQEKVPDAAAAVYTVPPDTQAIIKDIVVVNTTGSASTIALWTAGSADENVILPPVELGAGEFGEYSGSKTLNAGDVLYAEAGVDEAITITVSGLEKDVS